MNLCLTACPTIAIALLLIQCHFIQVDAEVSDINAVDENTSSGHLYDVMVGKNFLTDVVVPDPPRRRHWQNNNNKDINHKKKVLNSTKTKTEEDQDLNYDENQSDFSENIDELDQSRPLTVWPKKLPKRKKTKKNRRKHERVKLTRFSPAQIEKDFDAVTQTNAPKHGKRTFKKRKFVKMPSVVFSNSSDSNESTKKGKPVDIIVHIKMNE